MDDLRNDAEKSFKRDQRFYPSGKAHVLQLIDIDHDGQEAHEYPKVSGDESFSFDQWDAVFDRLDRARNEVQPSMHEEDQPPDSREGSSDNPEQTMHEPGCPNVDNSSVRSHPQLEEPNELECNPIASIEASVQTDKTIDLPWESVGPSTDDPSQAYQSPTRPEDPNQLTDSQASSVEHDQSKDKMSQSLGNAERSRLDPRQPRGKTRRPPFRSIRRPDAFSRHSDGSSLADIPLRHITGGTLAADGERRILTVFSFDQPPSLEIQSTFTAFNRAFEYCHLDQLVKYYILQNVDGFHEIKHSFSASPTDCARTYYLHVRDSYLLAWTFNLERGTRAIFIARPGRRSSFNDMVRKHRKLASQASYLAYIAAIDLLEKADTSITSELQTVVAVERKTGHSPWAHDVNASVVSVYEADETNFAVSSSMIGASSVVLSLLSRYLRIVERLLPFLESRNHSYALGPVNLTTMRDRDREAELCMLVDLLRSRVNSAKSYIDFIQERVRTQLSVLFHLITQEDANVNIQLAKDSRTLALSSKNDSSSMRTIAVMTMAFLPATFFAAFFALPLFDWETSPVPQRRFWVYWAFTLPITGLILIAWYIVTERRSRRDKLENRKQRAAVKDDVRSWRGSLENLTSGDSESGDDRVAPLRRRQSWMRRIVKRRRRARDTDSGSP